MKLIVDIETNGLQHEYQLREVGATKVCDRAWCVCTIDVDAGTELKWIESDFLSLFSYLQNAELLIGHDIQAFDLPILKKLYGFDFRGPIYDTKIIARLVYPDTRLDDWRSATIGKPWKPLASKKLWGSHKLEHWGTRLGIYKGDRDAQDFTKFSSEMVEYCMQDCRVTLALYKQLAAQNPSQESINLEQNFSKVIDQQKLNGFTLDIKYTEELLNKLQKERCIYDEQLKDLFPPRVIEFETPKLKLKRTKTIIFNPGSRDQIAYNLINKYGWVPQQFTDGGKPKVVAEVLEQLDYPEAKQLTGYLKLDKVIGQIAEGDYGWLRLVQSDGKIHGGVNTNGTVTGRVSCVYPNMANVPARKGKYGKECRRCFTASPGWWLVGADASGIQIRLLAHLMEKYDNGEYIRVVTTGDVHERNRQAFGLDTRDETKTGFYALLFGAGKKRFGAAVGRSEQEAGVILQSFFRSIPAFRLVTNDIRKVVALRGALQGLDKRRYPVRAKHLGLSVILQGYEAVIMKTAHVNLVKTLEQQGLIHGKDYKQILHLYDEGQFDVPTREIGEIVGSTFVSEITKAGQYYGIKCPLTGEYKIGKSWDETH